MSLILANNNAHSTLSSSREKLLEHLFVGDLLRCLWRRGITDIELLRPEVDRGGYDLMVEAQGIARHIQLKSSHRLAKTNRINVNRLLETKPSGCVIWLLFDEATMNLGPFLWFGNSPGAKLPPLGERIGKHTKGDRMGRKLQRPNIRVLMRGQFLKVSTIDAIAELLFGACRRPAMYV